MLEDGMGSVCDLATKVVIWPATLHFGTYLAGQVIGEAQPDQLVDHVKP